MANDEERLWITLEARLNDLEKGMNKAGNVVDRAVKQMQRNANSATRAMEADFARSTNRINQALASTSTRIGAFGKSMAVTFAAGLTLRGAQQLIDSATRIQNALKVAGLEGDNLNHVYDRLFISAQKNAAPLETLVTLYGRAALVQKELGISQEQLLNFTDKVALALRVAGTDAQAASGALLQLSQALGSGTVRAEEFNSILEGALPIARAAATGLKEAGGSVAKLRQLVVDGKVSSEAFFKAFEAGAVVLEDKVAGAELTVSQGFVRLQNVLTDTANEFNKNSDAAKLMNQFLGEVGEMVQDLGGWVAAASKPLTELADLLNGIAEAANGVGAALGRMVGADRIGKWLGAASETNSKANELTGNDAIRATIAGLEQDKAGAGSAMQGTLQAQIDELYAQLEGSESSGPSIRGGRREKTVVDTVSIEDYPATGTGKGKGKGKSTKDRADDYERLAARIADSTAATVAETEAQRQLNPLVDDYGYAAEKARMSRELLTAAEKAGKEVTPQLRAEIEALSEQYAMAGVEAAKLAEEQGKALDDMEFRKDLWKGALGDLRSALEDGKLSFQELGDIALSVLDKMIDKIETELLDAIFKLNNGGSGGGWLDAIFGGIGSLLGGGGGTGGDPWAGLRIPTFAKGTDFAPGGLSLVGEQGPELVNLPRGAQVIPNHQLGQAMGGGGQQSVKVQVEARFVNDGTFDAYVSDIAEEKAANTTARGIRSFVESRNFTDRVAHSVTEAHRAGRL